MSCTGFVLRPCVSLPMGRMPQRAYDRPSGRRFKPRRNGRRRSVPKRTTKGRAAQPSRMAGKSTTSRIVEAPVSIMTSRSMPMPMPPVGGMPRSSAWM